MGRAFCYGDHVDTDVIIPARYLTTDDPKILSAHALEDLDPAFPQTVKDGDIVFAGENFGCGSSREHAPIALKAAGIAGVVACSFARIFFRNAINVGLPILVSADAVAKTATGDDVELDFSNGIVTNLSKGSVFSADELPQFISRIVDAGGLEPWVRHRLACTG